LARRKADEELKNTAGKKRSATGARAGSKKSKTNKATDIEQTSSSLESGETPQVSTSKETDHTEERIIEDEDAVCYEYNM